MKKSFNLSIRFARYDGIVARIALVTERRGFSIENLSIDKCSDDFSCMKLTIEGDEARFEQVCKQLQKLIDVISLEVLVEEAAVVSAW